MSDYLRAIRHSSQMRIDALSSEIKDRVLPVMQNACVYATGSFGRLEAGPRSDLDLFIVSDVDASGKRILTNIEEIKLQHILIEAAERAGLPDFDKDGQFLKAHSITDYIQYLGGPEDDVRNTFTGRLLLLLESKPIHSTEIYDKLIDTVVDRYFRDFEGRESDFRPAFLINDILRMWRTFCVNYEHRRAPEGDRKSKVKNLKLKYCRMITCYSAILYLVAVYSLKGTVAKEDICEMISITPTERIERSANMLGEGASQAELQEITQAALIMYGKFIEFTHNKESSDSFEDWHAASYDFGNAMERALRIAGSEAKGAELMRFVLI